MEQPCLRLIPSGVPYTMAGRPNETGRAGRGSGADRKVTLRDVAKACGLSVYPVSRALSGSPGVTPETVDTVKRVAAELGYNLARNDLARRLSLRKSGKQPPSHVMGMLFPSQFGKVNFFFKLFNGAMDEISARGYGFLVVPTFDLVEHRPLTVGFPPAVERGEVDGLLVHMGMDPQMLRHLREETAFGRRPIVTMCAPRAGFPSVICDEKEGARLALAHLLSLGHRRILHFSRRTLGYPLSRRVEGYAAACSQAGLKMATSLISVPIGHDHEVEAPLAEAVRRHPDATALLALNDPNALYSCYTLKRLGRRIPDDLSVVGWDDTDPFPDANGVNQLTSVRFDIAGIGREAARKLVALAEGAADTPVETVMPPGLIARGSTAAPHRK